MTGPRPTTPALTPKRRASACSVANDVSINVETASKKSRFMGVLRSPTLTHPTRGPCDVTLPHHPVIGSIPLFARRRHRAEGVPLWTEPERRFGKGATNCQG